MYILYAIAYNSYCQQEQGASPTATDRNRRAGQTSPTATDRTLKTEFKSWFETRYDQTG